MGELVRVDTIYINKPWNILPNINEHIICSDKKIIISDFKIDIDAYGLDFSKDGYLYCCDLTKNKIHKLNNFVIVDSFEINSPDDILINNDEIIISECGKCNIFDSSFNFINSLEIESCNQINMGKYDDILVCDCVNNVVNIYSYDYEFKYNIAFERPWAVAMLNDVVIIANDEGMLYRYDDRLHHILDLTSIYFLRTANNKLYVPESYKNKINIFEFAES